MSRKLPVSNMMNFVHAPVFTPALALLLSCALCGVAPQSAQAADAGVNGTDRVDAHKPVNAEPISIHLPSKTDLANLSDLVADATNVSLKYDPSKLRGNVKLNIQTRLEPLDLWDVYNQVLIAQQYATVVTGNPAVYHVVPFNEAAMLSSMITKKEFDALLYKPSYLSIVHSLNHLPPEQAVKAISSLFFGNQVAQIRTLGQDDSRVVIVGVTAMVDQAVNLLDKLDQMDSAPVVRAYTPKFATPQSLQASSTAAWTALNRLSPGKFSGELQITPDNTRLLLIATQKHIDALEKLITDLDIAEPRSVKSYTPRFFTIDDVGDLIEQIFQEEEVGKKPSIIRDALTHALLINATTGQHSRIQSLMSRLDNVPPEGQQSMKSFVIKNRKATELVSILTSLLEDDPQSKGNGSGNGNSNGNTNNTNTQTNADNSNLPSTVESAASPQVNLNNSASNTSAAANAAATTPQQAQPNDSSALISANQGPSVRLTTDDHTNSIIAISTPQQLAKVEALIETLDQRQAQVELEIIMVNLNGAKTHELGIELARQWNKGGSSFNLASMFGVSKDLNLTTNAVNPPDNYAGLAGSVLNPGDFAGMIRAIETVTDGKGIIRSNTVIGNNAESKINSVREEPVTNFNAGDKFSTTTFSGTLDAGTEISITPQISAADYVTLTYEISQSTFLGESTITADGGTIPPPKRRDALSSVATIPDGYVIALGGLTEETDSESVSKIPLLGSIPLLGALFRSTSTSKKQSTFHIFIRATILRHNNFNTLKHRSAEQRRLSEIEDDAWPTLKTRLIK